MECPMTLVPYDRSPAICRHARVARIGIQESPAAPFRLYLVTCRDCGTTLTTETLRRSHPPRRER
jgi:hypothetical protein